MWFRAEWCTFTLLMPGGGGLATHTRRRVCPRCVVAEGCYGRGTGADPLFEAAVVRGSCDKRSVDTSKRRGVRPTPRPPLHPCATRDTYGCVPIGGFTASTRAVFHVKHSVRRSPESLQTSPRGGADLYLPQINRLHEARLIGLFSKRAQLSPAHARSRKRPRPSFTVCNLPMWDTPWVSFTRDVRSPPNSPCMHQVKATGTSHCHLTHVPATDRRCAHYRQAATARPQTISASAASHAAMPEQSLAARAVVEEGTRLRELGREEMLLSFTRHHRRSRGTEARCSVSRETLRTS